MATVQSVIDNSIARGMDPDLTQWDDDRALASLNEAGDYIQKLLIRLQSELVIERENIPMAATQEFSLSLLSGFWAMVDGGVYFSGEMPLTPITVEDAQREGSATTDVAPTMYYLTSTSIGLANIPTETAVAAYPELTCRYFKAFSSLTLTDEMPFGGLLDKPMAAFMAHVGVMEIQGQTAEVTALYNALEESAMEIVKRRTPL